MAVLDYNNNMATKSLQTKKTIVVLEWPSGSGRRPTPTEQTACGVSASCMHHVSVVELASVKQQRRTHFPCAVVNPKCESKECPNVNPKAPTY